MAAEQHGPRDLERTLGLLWRGTDGPRRGPQPTLTLDRIVERAVELADAEGLEAVSMRRVAEGLGFTSMSLYRHVPGKAELLDLMVDAVNAESAYVDDLAGGWREKLTVIAQEEWKLFHRHPWVLALGWNQQALGPNGLAAYESALGAVAELGLDVREQVAVLHALLNFVKGAARSSVEAGSSAAADAGEQRWLVDWMPALEHYVDLERYPRVERLTAFDTQDWVALGDFALQFGLERFLDGVEVLLRRRGVAPD